MEELEDLERYLSRAEILTWGGVGLDCGHPEKHLIVLAGGVQAIAKPGIENLESVVLREAAGWQVAKELGFVGLVAGTVVREVPRLSTGDNIMSFKESHWTTRSGLRPWSFQLPETGSNETF